MGVACMLECMAIHMKEWGMLRAPSPAVHIPVQGVTGWGEVAESVGRGISTLLLGSTALAKEKEQVETTGDLAEFSRRLHAIGDETRAQLAERDVQDWDYAWQEVSEPRFAEAVAELPPAAREAGREFAEYYSRRAALEALRDRELQQLGKARNHWQQRVDAAVQAGDAEQAEHWLQSAAGVFVPQGELEGERARVRSRACSAGWRAALAERPLQALADWELASPDSLPQDPSEKQQLQAAVELARKSARAQLGQEMAQLSAQQQPYDDSALERATTAGLISRAQLENAQQKPQELQTGELCCWQRRVDEVADDESARLDLQLDILTSPMLPQQRNGLMARLNAGGGVPQGDRQALSYTLWDNYSAGYFGVPGDDAALQRLSQLQQSGSAILANEGREAAFRWLESEQGDKERWVCFTSFNN